MTAFDAAWLDLRAPADKAARARSVLDACRACFRDRESLSICDLGAGTGAAVAAFGPFLPPDQRWLLVDSAPDALAEARRRNAGSRAAVETRVVDLARSPAIWPDGCGLVTATALFDLAAPAWIEALAAALADARLPLLATLTYDGAQTLAPPHSLDADLIAAFNRHQKHDKGLGGPAAGPDATAVLVGALERRGYHVIQAPSPWRLERPSDGALMRALLTGWADAIAAAGYAEPARTTAWLDARLRDTSAMTVGHVDIFATPPE